MRIQDLAVRLPKEWVVDGVGRIQKRPSKDYVQNPYAAGLMVLKKTYISPCSLTEEQITDIGKCVFNNTKILVTKFERKWVIMPCTPITCKNGGYIIKGREVIPLQHHRQGSLHELMDKYESGGGPVISRLTTEGLFASFQGKRTHKGKKRGQMGFKEYQSRVECKTEETKKTWKRGEKVKARNEHKRLNAEGYKEFMTVAHIKVARYGLIYHSEPKATRYNCGRVIY